MRVFRELGAAYVARRWRELLAGAAADRHPTLTELADVLRLSRGVVPPRALDYVCALLRGEIKPTPGRPARREPRQLDVIRRLVWRARYDRYTTAYAALKQRLATAQLKPASRARLQAAPHQLAIRRIAERWRVSEETARKIVHSKA